MSILKYFKTEEPLFLPKSDSGTENAANIAVSEAQLNDAGGSKSKEDRYYTFTVHDSRSKMPNFFTTNISNDCVRKGE